MFFVFCYEISLYNFGGVKMDSKFKSKSFALVGTGMDGMSYEYSMLN